MTDVTRLLAEIETGHSGASNELLPLVYDELRRLAAAKLNAEKPGQTLQATALVHEAYLRLIGNTEPVNWNSRGHLFGAAAEAMRRILIEQARQKKRLKRGGDRNQVPLSQVEVADFDRADELLALDAALDELEAKLPEVAQVVKLHYFSGLTVDQASQALGISPRTAHRHWNYAKAWLFRHLEALPFDRSRGRM